MAILAASPIRCWHTCSRSTTLHSSPQAHRAALANNSLLCPRIGIHICEREGKRKDKSCEGSKLCAQILVCCLRRSSRGVSRWIHAGILRSSREIGNLDHGALSRKRLGKEVRSSSEAASQDKDGGFKQEAREAVVRVLREAGLSKEDAEIVVSKAPMFIQELIGCFRELEESDLLAEEEGTDVYEDVDTRERVYQLAIHSRGMSPFLESLGVHLPSVSKISASLYSQQIPDLLRKVRYFEELFAETEPRSRPLDGLIQFMVKNLSVSVWDDEDIQRTLFFFEKMNHHDNGLRALEEKKSLVPLFIEAFPQIFKRNLEDQIMPVVRFLEGLSIEGDNLGKVILCFPSVLLQNPEKDLVPRKRTLKKVGIRVADMGRMVVKYPWLLSKCVGNNVEVLVQFFESVKVPKSKIDGSITRCPHLLGCSCTVALEPMIHHINGYGLKSKRLGRAISQSPELLLHTPEEFDAVVAFLESVGVEANDISKLLRRSPEILGSSIEGTLEKKVKFLEELGVHRKKLGRIITFFPEILSMSVESALIPRINHLCEWGFARHEISRMVFKFPPLLGYNAEAVLSPKLEFLTRTMRRSIKDVVDYPRYFSHSLEKKIKPRARVLENRQIQCDLKTMLAKSDDHFAANFLGFESMLILPKKSVVEDEF